LKSEGFHVLAIKKKNLALHVYQTINQKEGRKHDFGFFRGKGWFFSLCWLSSSIFLFSLSFYIIGNPNPFSTK
jgi:hypothetical protein